VPPRLQILPEADAAVPMASVAPRGSKRVWVIAAIAVSCVAVAATLFALRSKPATNAAVVTANVPPVTAPAAPTAAPAPVPVAPIAPAAANNVPAAPDLTSPSETTSGSHHHHSDHAANAQSTRDAGASVATTPPAAPSTPPAAAPNPPANAAPHEAPHPQSAPANGSQQYNPESM
jgi:hypothetical protein